MSSSLALPLRSIRRIAVAGVLAQATLLGAWYATADETPTVAVSVGSACSCATPHAGPAPVAPSTPI